MISGYGDVAGLCTLKLDYHAFEPISHMGLFLYESILRTQDRLFYFLREIEQEAAYGKTIIDKS